MTETLSPPKKKKPGGEPAGFFPGALSRPRGRNIRTKSRECNAGQVIPAHWCQVYRAHLNVDPPSTSCWIYRSRCYAHKLRRNKTRQGYARKRTLKPAGYFFWTAGCQGADANG